ncbi:Ras GTPase-activating-like protein IQGAP3 [Nosema granulosis]|uniref:Ras GTPase-activating-like protein IQGAP3 n=1 Tax=Nosema granulosis TaxID=83296 RepID=A0A9P6L013_9MICR|nr:Ras GTPase-activating-like protein IQGAP3 [Nosema granulosis]
MDLDLNTKKEEFKRNSINVHQRLGRDIQVTQEEMDIQRKNSRVYDYLCRLEEAKAWIGRTSNVPESYTEFEEEMRKGVYLAEVAHMESIFVDEKLQYRHTDNINGFLRFLKKIGLPSHFHFDVIDLYEKKNFPKVVYCIHALAHFLEKKGKRRGIESAEGTIFSKEDLERLDSEIEKIKLPAFKEIKERMHKDENNAHEKDEEHKNNDSHKSNNKNDETNVDESEDDLLNKLRKEAEEELLRMGDSSTDISTGDVPRESFSINAKIKSFLCRKAFEDIYFRKNVSLFSIKKFLFVFFKESSEMIKETDIDDLQRKINKKMKEIYEKEGYLEDIENRIRLMISNKLDLHNIKARTSKLEEMDLKPLEGILQRLITHPKELGRLLSKVEDKESFISSTILPMFSGVRGKKEEYLFSGLVREVDPILGHLLMVGYFRESQEGGVFKEGLYGIVKNLDNVEVDCNPTEIYRSLFGKEVPMDVALENERVKDSMKTRLVVVRGVLSSIVSFIESNIDSIPYILRHFLKNSKIGFFTGFLSSFLIAPDVFNSELGISRNLREKSYKIVQLMILIENGSLQDSKLVDSKLQDSKFEELDYNSSPDLFYSPILPFLESLSKKYQDVLSSILSVGSLDNYFQSESLNEMVRIQKSTVYLPVKVANALILLLSNPISTLPDDNNILLPLTLRNTNSYTEKEIALENFLRNTKRKIIYLIKICRGRNLVDLLNRESTEKEKDEFMHNEEFMQNAELSDFMQNELSEFCINSYKESVVDDLKFLEEKGLVSRSNLYAEVLSMLAQDIVLLRFMSQERSRELRVNQLTLTNLLAREDYLDIKTQEYDDYFKTYSSKMVSKKELVYPENSPVVKLKKVSPYGSYYFTAEDLQGVIKEIYDVPDSRDIFFILRSESPLSFALEVYINNLLISSPYNFRLEDILYMKKKNQKEFDVLGICSFNTQPFVDLLNERYLK